jgi:hypothetical protein
MVNKDLHNRVLAFCPSQDYLIRVIRRVAANGRNVGFNRSSRIRLDEHDITDVEAIRVLRTGKIQGDIETGNTQGEWRCKVLAPIKGGRSLGVVTVVTVNGRLLVQEIEWEES